jgi:uncharacterized membrane protein
VQERFGALTASGPKDGLARGLGWFSLGLGAAQILAPRAFSRAVGLTGSSTQGTVVRAVGVREIAAGVGILSRSKPGGWLWARVAGDAMDLVLLAVGDSRKGARRAAAMAAVAGVTVPDVLEGTRLSFVARNGTEPDSDAIEVTKAVTVQRTAEDVYRFWRDLENLPGFMEHLESVEVSDGNRSHWVAKGPAGRSIEWDAEIVEERPGERLSWRSLPGTRVQNEGSVDFKTAPGGRGTEVAVHLRYSPPGGTLGAAVAKLLGEEPATQLVDDLRRFKQVIETGEIARSDSSPGGHSLRRHLRQRPAQPVPSTNGGAR